MGIRITDQPGDQSPQNPPQEHDATLIDGQTKTVASVTVDALTPTPTVLRGVHHAAGLCLIQDCDIPSDAPRTSCPGHIETSETNTRSDLTEVSMLGWVRRDTGASERIGAIEDHIVRKLPPHWTIAPKSATDLISSEQNKVSQ